MGVPQPPWPAPACACGSNMAPPHPAHWQVLMYINGLINFKASRLAAATKADPSLLLRNSKGERTQPPPSPTCNR